MDPGLSRRAQKTLKELLPAFATGRHASQHSDKPDNSTIDLSSALNEVIHPELLEFLKSTVEEHVTSEALASRSASLHGGNTVLREALASFFNTYFQPIHTVKPEHIVLTTGASDAIENVIHAVCDDGDSVLVPGPHWPGFTTLLQRKVNITPIIAQPPTYSHWDNYLVPSLQAAYDFSDQKARIKAVLLCNPNTPLSRCYPRKTMLELMEFCQERGLHLICDEVYALTGLATKEQDGADADAKAKSTPAPAEEFVSALSLTEPLVPEGAVKVDPSRVHVVWSASGVFGLGGLKIGCLITQQNPTLHTLLALSTTPPSTLSTLYLTHLLTWPYLPTLLALARERLSTSYHLLASFLRAAHIDFVPPTHGLVLFAKLGAGVRGAEQEAAFFEDLGARGGVRVAQGRWFREGEKEFGWCRVRFSVEERVMGVAVARLGKFLESRG
ncbi:PLP-dependent transferase [Decorospora gaudefroyi]|uniref:PLP-dependent transferase n=1 Tax=Decorospora gaudefroyi TaxID=184978 RepID=A0A6A5KGA4_9PLEO|nr:PLP-dependent transferase [Decorospora gaudefroyi]